MKRITLIMAAFAISIVSCQKEKLNPQDAPSVEHQSSATQQTFKYSETVTIFDESGKYSMDQLIQCNDEKTFNQEIKNVKSMQLKLSYSSPKKNETPTIAPTSILKSPPENFGWEKEKNTIYTTFKNVKIGEAKGFCFEPKNKAKSTVEEWSGYCLIGPAYHVWDFSQSLYQLELTFIEGYYPVDVIFSTYNVLIINSLQLSSTNSFTSLPVTWGYTSHLSLRRLGPGVLQNPKSIVNMHWYAIPW